MVTQLDSTPATIDVATAQIDTWAIDFSGAIQEGEAISDADAVLVSTACVPNREIEGFVTDADVDDASVLVAWTGEPLAQGGDYVLHTRAILDTGAVLVLLTRVRCVG